MSAYRPDQPILDGDGKLVTRFRFRKLSEISDALTTSINDHASGHQRSSAKIDSSTEPWPGTNRPQEYVSILRDGWKSGVIGVEGLEGISTDKADNMTFQPSVCGTYLDGGAYQAGDPECMLEFLPEPSDAVRGLTLVIDSCFPALIDAQTVLSYARQVMQLVAWLQAAHVETSVYAVIPVQMGRKRFIYTTPIRETGDVLMPERIAAILHPAFLRRGWFAMVEQEFYKQGMAECGVCERGYGRVRNVTADELRQCLPEAYSVILLPKVGSGDPFKAIQESLTLKLRQE